MEFLPLTINGEKVYAGFWRRFGAAIADTIIFFPIYYTVYLIESHSVPAAIMSTVLKSAFFWFYTIFFHYKYGATFGKMVAGIVITSPDSSAISFKQAFLRSSVDLGFMFFLLTAEIMALSKVDPVQYLNSSWLERSEHTQSLLPNWYIIIFIISMLWYWGEFFVLLLNTYNRAIHDYIAGTIVINKGYMQNIY